MNSPLLRFLEWFESLPNNHKSKIVGFISMTDGSFNDLSAHQMGTIDELNKEKINRFVDKILKTDQLMLKHSTYYKWEGIGLLLSLRSQIDFLLSHPGYYYFLEAGYVESLDIKKTAAGIVLKEAQMGELINHVKRSRPERESQLSDILLKWEQYKSNFASDKYIDEYYFST